MKPSGAGTGGQDQADRGPVEGPGQPTAAEIAPGVADRRAHGSPSRQQMLQSAGLELVAATWPRAAPVARAVGDERLDGAEYEIDLNARHAQELRDTLARYMGAARRAGGAARRPACGARRGPASGLNTTEVHGTPRSSAQWGLTHMRVD